MTISAVEQGKTLHDPRVRRISPVGEKKAYGEIDLPKSPSVLGSKWKTERVTEDKGGDSEDCEGDELRSVIGGGKCR